MKNLVLLFVFLSLAWLEARPDWHFDHAYEGSEFSEIFRKLQNWQRRIGNANLWWG